MTKSQLVETVAIKIPRVPRREIEEVINGVFERMVQALCRRERIEIRGFGVFGIKSREAGVRRNPKTGAKVEVPRRVLPFFTVGKELRERLNRPQVAPEAPTRSSAAEPLPVPMAAAPQTRSTV